MTTTPEGKVKAKIDKVLKSYPNSQVWYFNPQSGIYGRSGVPDKIICANGHFIGVEVKSDKSKHPTRLQEQCMTKITEAGGVCFVVYDDDTLHTLVEYIEKCL